MRQTSLARAHFDWRQYVVYGGFIVVFIVFSISLYGSGFLTLTNLLNIVRQTATITVMAVAMTFVIAAGEIDLSVGSLAGLASVTTAMAVGHFGVMPGILAGILTGLLVGSINGLLVTKVLIPSFLVTLGMLGIGNGIAMWITDTAPVPIASKVFNNVFGSGEMGPLPSLAIWTVVALVVGHVALRKTPYGRKVLATGGNEIASSFSGVKTKRIKFLALMISGVAAALGGMLYAGRLHSGRFQWGQGDELSVIAAVILGGTSLSGGVGSVVGAVIGSLLIGLINNGLLLMGLAYSQQLIIRGAIIILAVALGRRAGSM
ncbi:MAG TPA: ABC transporter permease [Spirochaetia bacterium]|nr:ABC transporter permease [Spirochaetia bacterium]